MRWCTGQLCIERLCFFFCWGISIVVTVHHIYQLTCPCVCMCYVPVCVQNWSNRLSMWQLFATAPDAIGYNEKACNRICFAFVINPIFCFMSMTILIWMPRHIQLSRFRLYALFWHSYRCLRSEI